MSGSLATRTLRAAVFTALAVPLAALGQVVLTGRALPPTLVLACSAAVLVLSVALGGVRQNLLRLTAVMVPVQLLLNTAFNLGQDGCATAATRTHGVDLLVCGGGSVPSGAFSGVLSGTDAGTVRLLVLLTHLALALAASLWLRLGDTALDGAARTVRAARSSAGALLRRLVLLLTPGPVRVHTRPPAAAPGTVDVPPLPRHAVPGPAPRRGPPGFALAR